MRRTRKKTADIGNDYASEHRGDPSKLSTWVKYRKAYCNGCYAGCCTLPVEVSVHDLIRLGLTTEDEAAVSLKRLARRLVREGVIQSFRAKSQIFILQQKHGSDCLYLNTEDRRCTVYEKRPEVCRAFPRIGPKPGYCPSLHPRQSLKKV